MRRLVDPAVCITLTQGSKFAIAGVMGGSESIECVREVGGTKHLCAPSITASAAGSPRNCYRHLFGMSLV
jgi:hypothetical protein